MVVGGQARDQIDEETVHTAVAAVFNLRDVLELIVDGFDSRYTND